MINATDEYSVKLTLILHELAFKVELAR